MKEIFESEDVYEHTGERPGRKYPLALVFLIKILLKVFSSVQPKMTSIVNTYMRNSNGLYRKVNEALRREGLE